jgi:DNA-binding HxlR family transcriptional regulator
MRSYGQYCALARALDVVGDRWALLVVRELLEGPRRYGELLNGLPDIATNLLADRLRSLESAGVIAHDQVGLYSLTEWGYGLRGVLNALGRWAGPLMLQPIGSDTFRGHWMSYMVGTIFEGVDPERPDVTVEIHPGGEAPMTLIAAAGRVDLTRSTISHPDATLTGPPDGIIGLITGLVSVADASRLGVVIGGDADALARLSRPASHQE